MSVMGNVCPSARDKLTYRNQIVWNGIQNMQTKAWKTHWNNSTNKTLKQLDEHSERRLSASEVDNHYNAIR